MWENPACCNSSRSQSGRASSTHGGGQVDAGDGVALGGQQHGKKAAARCPSWRGSGHAGDGVALGGQQHGKKAAGPESAACAGRYRCSAASHWSCFSPASSRRRWAENAPARRVQYPVMRFCRLASIFVSFPPGGANKSRSLCAAPAGARNRLRPANSVQNARRNGNRRGRLLPHPVFWPDPALRRRGRGPHPLQ